MIVADEIKEYMSKARTFRTAQLAAIKCAEEKFIKYSDLKKLGIEYLNEFWTWKDINDSIKDDPRVLNLRARIADRLMLIWRNRIKELAYKSAIDNYYAVFCNAEIDNPPSLFQAVLNEHSVASYEVAL